MSVIAKTDNDDISGKNGSYYYSNNIGVNNIDLYNNNTSAIWVAPGYELCIK